MADEGAAPADSDRYRSLAQLARHMVDSGKFDEALSILRTAASEFAQTERRDEIVEQLIAASKAAASARKFDRAIHYAMIG